MTTTDQAEGDAGTEAGAAAVTPVTTAIGLSRVVRVFSALSGWRRRLVAFGLGALACLALPPAGLVVVLPVALVPLVWMVAAQPGIGAAFGLGWWFGFGHFVVGLYWISFALLVDAGRFAWLLPVAIAGLPAVLALFTGAALAAARALPGRGLGRPLGVAVAWGAAEWLRGHLFTGFPWQLIGYAWVAWPPMLQAAAWLGIYGLGALTVAAATVPAVLGDPTLSRRTRIAAVAVAVLGLSGLAGAGALRLAAAPAATVPGVTLRLVQPAVPQHLKWRSGLREVHFARHLGLSAGSGAAAAPAPVVVTIWPETAVTFFLENDPDARRRIAELVRPGSYLITGVPRTARDRDGTRRYWNSLAALDHRGRIVARYDKFHLVPFGEYLPGRDWVPAWLPLGAVASGAVDFSAGPGPRTLALPGLPPVSPLICYEVIFPGAVTAPAPRPAWLLNLTNDAWYGRTAGPHQHFAIARVRAVEEGLPLVRVATTGISGVVDPFGRVQARLELGAQGVVDAPLPVGLDRPTLYTRIGDWGFAALLLLGALVVVVSRYTR